MFVFSKNQKLAVWVKQQRTNLRLMEENKSSALTIERRDLLDSIGFVWSKSRKKREFSPSLSNGNLVENVDVVENEKESLESDIILPECKVGASVEAKEASAEVKEASATLSLLARQDDSIENRSMSTSLFSSTTDADSDPLNEILYTSYVL